MDADLTRILGPDPSQFEALISNLMSSVNEQRSQAESIFNLIKQNDPNSIVLKLAQLLATSVLVESRAMAAILLRKQLTRDDSFIWPHLTESTRSTVKNTLLTYIQKEETKLTVKKLCDTVSELASSLLPKNQWSEILPFMFQCGDEDAGETSNYSVGHECLDRLAISLGGNTIAPVASELSCTYGQAIICCIFCRIPNRWCRRGP